MEKKKNGKEINIIRGKKKKKGGGGRGKEKNRKKEGREREKGPKKDLNLQPMAHQRPHSSMGHPCSG